MRNLPLRTAEPASTSRPSRGSARGVAGRDVLLILLALLLTAAMGYAIPSLPGLQELDRALVASANAALGGTGALSGAGALGGAAAGAAIGIDLAFAPLQAALLAVVLATILALRHRSLWPGARFVLLIVVPWGAVGAIKLVVRRPRPEADLLVHHLALSPESSSYPSGHTAVVAALCVATLCSLPRGSGVRDRPDPLDRQGRRDGRTWLVHRLGASWWVGVVLTVLVVGATAWSRVALGMHHPTDVLASALLAPTLGLLLARLLDLRRSGSSPAGTAPSQAAPTSHG